MRIILTLAGAAAIGGCIVTRPPALRSSPDDQRAARQSGLYVTAGDFDAHRLTDPIACASASRPLDRDAFGGAEVLSWGGATPPAQYSKTGIFGFRACDGTDVRFVRGANFRVVRASPLYLYQHEYQVPMGRSGSRLVAEYFFSTTPADSVRPLTVDALKQAYPQNHRFHDLLDLAFRQDGELMRYDDFHHEYRVARLLRESVEQTAARRSEQP